MTLKSFKKVPLAIAAAVIVAASLYRLMPWTQTLPPWNYLLQLEWDTYDFRARNSIDTSQAAATNLAAIFIDDDSLQEVNRVYGFSFPWPRQIYGRVLRELKSQGARAVAIDILFAELHPPSDATAVETPGTGRIGSDEFFARQLREFGRAILSTGPASSQSSDLLAIPDLLRTNAWKIGYTGAGIDADGVLRRAPAFVEDRYMGRVWELGILLAAANGGLELEKARVEKDAVVVPAAGNQECRIPCLPDGTFYINWTMPLNDPRLEQHSIWEVLQMDAMRQSGKGTPEAVFKDKLVLIGSIGTGNNIADMGVTPLARHTFLCVRYWNIANQIMTRQFIRNCPVWLELALYVLMALAAMLMTWELRPWLSSVGVIVLSAGYVMLAFWLFKFGRFWLPIVLPVGFALFLTHVCSLTYRVVWEQREQRRVKSVFSKVVSPEVVKELLEAPKLALGGAQRRVTVYFADVRGFTEFTDLAYARAEEYARLNNLSGAAAEEFFNAQSRELLGTVNLYLSTIASIVKQHRGTLDKYIGDCVMAFWGAPVPNEKQEVTAVRAAIAAQRALDELNRQRAEENRRREEQNIKRAAAGQPPLALLPLLSLGTGINTGLATVGLMGDDAHMWNYTVFGREVNLASRLEGMSGRGRILIGEATYQALLRDEPELAARCIPQPPVPVKGFRKPVQAYEVPWKVA